MLSPTWRPTARPSRWRRRSRADPEPIRRHEVRRNASAVRRFPADASVCLGGPGVFMTSCRWFVLRDVGEGNDITEERRSAPANINPMPVSLQGCETVSIPPPAPSTDPTRPICRAEAHDLRSPESLDEECLALWRAPPENRVGDIRIPALGGEPLISSSDRDEHQAHHAECELHADADHHDDPKPACDHRRASVGTGRKEGRLNGPPGEKGATEGAVMEPYGSLWHGSILFGQRKANSGRGPPDRRHVLRCHEASHCSWTASLRTLL